MADSGSRYSFPETSPRDFCNVLFRRKKKIIAFFVSVMFVVALGTFISSKVYKSEAELLLRIGRENATVGPTVATGRVININQDRENEINSEVDIIKCRELAGKVVEAIGARLILKGAKESLPPDAPLTAAARYWTRRALNYPLTALSRLRPTGSGASTAADRQREKELAVLSLINHLGVDVSTKSNMIVITYETNDPALAQSVLNRLVGFYLEKHIEVNRTPGSYAFFKNQKDVLSSSLEQTEEELRDLKNRTSVASISEQRRILLGRIGAMKSELENTGASAAASEARVKTLAATLARVPPTVRKDETTGFAGSAADEMRKQIYDLELKEQNLLSTFTQKSIPVQEIRREVEQGKALLLKAEQQNQVSTGINENYQKLQLDLLTEKGNLASLQSKALAISSQLKSAGSELNGLNDTEMRFERLDRDLSTKRSNYLKYSDSLEQARIDEALDMQRISNISIVEPATLSLKAVRPTMSRNLALSFFLGIFGSLALAFFSEFQDHSLKRPEDVGRRLHLPMLAALPMVFPEKTWSGFALAGQSPVQAETRCELLLGVNGNSAAIGDLLHFHAHGTAAGLGAIAMVGCHSGEGASTASAFLARQLAQRGEGRYLLVDANSISPGLHTRFGNKLAPGLGDFGSTGRSDLASIQPTSFGNLDILSAGNGGLELAPGALRAFSEALPVLRREYSLIICDLPPLLEHRPAMRIAALMDGVILVVEAEKTHYEVANKVRESLAQADSNVLGVILNKRRFHIPEWLYKRL